jgi:hypothetical protein
VVVVLLLLLLTCRGGEEEEKRSTGLGGGGGCRGGCPVLVLWRSTKRSPTRSRFALPWWKKMKALELVSLSNNKRQRRRIFGGVPRFFLLAGRGGGGEDVIGSLQDRSSRRSVRSPPLWGRSWRLRDLMLCHGIDLSLVSLLVESPRWWQDEGGEADEVFFLFNKWLLFLLWFCWIRRLLLPSLVGHGGMSRGSKLESICSIRGGGGVQERIIVEGMLAFTTLCRHGGGFLTSGEEALCRPGCGCSKPLEREVIRSPRSRGGPQLLVVAGKELPSKRLWFLGGFALRTPTNGGGDARGLDCIFFFCPRVFCLKGLSLSLDRRSPRARLERTFLQIVPVTALI